MANTGMKTLTGIRLSGCFFVPSRKNLTFLTMPRFKPSILISDCWGSVGDLTFYHVDGRCYYKKKPQCEFRGTDEQLAQASVHARALAAWRSIPHETQLVWNELARPVISHRPPFDNKGGISGYNLFVSAYHGFVTLGQEHVPYPQPWEPFPPHSLSFLDAAVVDGTDLRLSFSVSFSLFENPGRYQVLTRIQLTQLGRGKKPGLMRNFLADSPCSAGEGTVRVLVDDFRRRWDLDLQEYQVHCRYVLLDRQTGYRNHRRDLSFPINLN